MLNSLAQYYTSSFDYSYTPADAGAFAGLAMGMIFLLMVPALIVGVLTIIGMWKVYTKAGKPGWAVIVPIYNIIVLLEIVGRPTWWVFLYLLSVIPVVGWIASLIVTIIVLNDLSKTFGKDVGYTLLLLFLPFVGAMVLGFGDAKYKGPIKHAS